MEVKKGQGKRVRRASPQIFDWCTPLSPVHKPAADTYSPATVCGIYGRRTLLCCVNFSPKLTSPDVVSVKNYLSVNYFSLGAI